MNLVDLLKLPGGKTLGFTRDMSNSKGTPRTIVAFANTAGGTMILGVEDEIHRVRGISGPLGTEERAADLISDSIVPRLSPEINILSRRRTRVLAILPRIGLRSSAPLPTRIPRSRRSTGRCGRGQTRPA